jgi:hypothetical protein
MGLDVFFYKRPNVEPPKPSCDEILSKLNTENKELERALQRLCEYADHFNETIDEQLIEAINEYVGSYDVNDDKDELAFLCKNWWIVETLNYTEDGKNMRLSREDLEMLRDKAMNAIRDTLSHLSLDITRSPLDTELDEFAIINYTTSASERRTLGIEEEIVRRFDWRGVIELEDGKYFSLCDERDADRVCRGILRVKTVDGYMFAKTCLVYWKTSKMLREVDWDNEHVVMNATW